VEDGRGGRVAPERPVAIDLRRPAGWPGRALDPVLHVGPLRFRDYAHAGPEVLRFVADAAALPEGAEVAVWWGDDRESRIVVAGALEVPR